MPENEQGNTKEVEKEINNKQQDGSEGIGEMVKKTAKKYYGYFDVFIAFFGILSMLYYAITIKSDIEMMNGELRDRIDTVKGIVNLVDKKIEYLDNKIEFLDNKIEFLDKKFNDKIEFLDNKIGFRLDVLNEKVDKFNERFDTLEVLIVNSKNQSRKEILIKKKDKTL